MQMAGYLAAGWIHWSHPAWLWTMALVAVPALAAWWGRGRGRHVPVIAVVLQTLAVALAAAALARPMAPLGRTIKPYLVLTDVSGSAKGQHDRPLPWRQDLPREDMVFADGVADNADRIGAEATHAAPALRLAASRAGEVAGVILRTDGQFQDDWQAAADALGRSGTGVYIVPMASPPPDGQVSAMDARRGSDGTVRLTVTASANAPMRRVLVVRRSIYAAQRRMDVDVLRRPLRLVPNMPATLRLTDSPPADSLVEYTARLDADAGSPGEDSQPNNVARLLVLPDRPSVGACYCDRDTPAAHTRLLQRLGISQTWVVGDASRYIEWAAIVFFGPVGPLLDKESSERLAGYVRAGGGLVLVGDTPHEDVADRDDPLTRISALVTNPFERQPMDLTVVLDASGSMSEPAADDRAGRTRFDAAAEGVLALKRHLTPKDSLRVIAFRDEAEEVWQSKPGEMDFADLRDALLRVGPRGPTDVMKGLALAAGVPAGPKRVGLVILLSDLVPTKPVQAAVAAAKLKEAKLRLAVIGVLPPGKRAPETAPVLEIARHMAAPVVTRDRLTGLAEVFADFLNRARADALRTGRFTMPASGEAFGARLADLPALDSYYLSGAPEGSEVLLRIGDDPILARRQVGLGRVVTLALPITRRQNAAWAESPAFAELLQSAIEWARRREQDSRFAVTTQRDGSELRVSARAIDEGKPMNALKLTAEAKGTHVEHGTPTQSVELTQVGPGRYEGLLFAPDVPGSHHTPGSAPRVLAGVLQITDDKGRRVYRAALSEPVAAEYARIGANEEAIEELARRTGGKVVSSLALADLTAAGYTAQQVALWPWLLGVATALMLAEWCMTRVWRRA